MVRKFAIALGIFALAGCAREVDLAAVGADQVPGVNALYRFCDGPVLIYVSKITGESDQFDWFWPGGCVWDVGANQWVFSNQPPPPGTVPNGDSTEDGGK